MPDEIRSESQFLWKFILHVLLTPITFILILFGKKGFKDLLQPFRELFRFIFEPKFTITIIIINIIIFGASFLISDTAFTSLINYPSDLLELKLYTLISAGFLHANVLHLVGNMVGIFIFGRVVERKLGFLKTLFLYLGALIISSLFTSLIHLLIIGDNRGGLGASGALMGLVATAILLNPFYLTYEALIPLPIMFMGWLAIFGDIIGILNPVEDGIGHFAHLGGFFSVVLLMFFIGIDDKEKLKNGFIINLVSLALGIIIYFLFV